MTIPLDDLPQTTVQSYRHRPEVIEARLAALDRNSGLYADGNLAGRAMALDVIQGAGSPPMASYPVHVWRVHLRRGPTTMAAPAPCRGSAPLCVGRVHQPMSQAHRGVSPLPLHDRQCMHIAMTPHTADKARLVSVGIIQ